MRGTFITFEGDDGVGKSTQVKLLAQQLSLFGNVFVTREPGGTELGEKIRSLLKEPYDIDPLCDLLLIFAARRDHFVKQILPHLERGDFVISDRFYDSSLIYQGVLKGVPIEEIMQLKRMVMADFEPDITIILDMDVEKSKTRLNLRSLVHDEYDSMDIEKHNLVRNGFRKIAEIFSFRAVLVNASGSEQNVASRVFKILQDKIATLEEKTARLEDV